MGMYSLNKRVCDHMGIYTAIIGNRDCRKSAGVAMDEVTIRNRFGDTGDTGRPGDGNPKERVQLASTSQKCDTRAVHPFDVTRITRAIQHGTTARRFRVARGLRTPAPIRGSEVNINNSLRTEPMLAEGLPRCSN